MPEAAKAFKMDDNLKAASDAKNVEGLEEDQEPEQESLQELEGMNDKEMRNKSEKDILTSVYVNG